MKNKGKSSFKKLFRISIVTILTVYFCVVFVKQEIKIISLKKDAGEIKVKIEEARDKKKALDENMKEDNRLKTVEKIARDKLGFLKHNEILFVDSSEK